MIDDLVRDETASVVYVVVWCDRHTDDLVDKVFIDKDRAIEYARFEAGENIRGIPDLDEHLTKEMKRDGWVYYARYTTEDGDFVYVVPMEVQR